MPEKLTFKDNEDIKREIAKSKEADKLTPELVEIFKQMSRSMVNKLNYSHEEDREDCYLMGVEHCIKYWKKYDTEKPNAYAYFSEVIKRGMAWQYNNKHGKGGYTLFVDPSTSIYKLSLPPTP